MRTKQLRRHAWVAAALALGGCPRPAAVADAGPAAAELPAPVEFSGRETSLLFSFVDEAGAVRSVDTLADVPAAQRRTVMVVDLARTPEQRQADRYVFFADVTAPGPDGKFHANPVSRYQPARAAAASPAPGAAAAEGVVVYSAVWCGFCKQTKTFLRERGVAFTERDVEKDPGAEQELQAKARRAGVRVSGVPVTDFQGELVMGFDQAHLDALIRKARAPAP